jgi:hypothetical protein
MIQYRAGFRILNFAKIASVILALFAALPARADIVIDWPEIVVASDGVNPVNGFADIFITLTGADLISPPSIDAFNLRFDVVSGVGLTFGTPQNAVVNPLFPNTNFFAAGSYPSTTVEAANDGTGVVLANGKGLIRAPFTAPGNGQTYTISINTQDTQLSYQGNAFNFVASGGSVTVQAVPEPAAVFGMGIVALVSAAGAVATRRKLART